MSSGVPERDRTLTFAGGAKAVEQTAFALPERWRVARLLGAGGQAEVWLAFDAELSEWVAVKVFGGSLTEVQKERLRREVRLGRSLSHPGLVRIFELIEGGDRLAVAMEWVQGESLARRVDEGPLPIGEVIAIAEQVLDVLGFLAAQRIVHRDVKPSNLLLDGDGRVRLADLGLVRPLGDDADLTRTATTVGTPGFMSPEQLKGEELTPASDLYSLGVTLYQLLTGRAPFTGRSAFEVADRHLRAAPPSPRKLRPDCPPWLDRFVLRLLQKRPADRFCDAAAAREALLRRRMLVSPRFRRRAAAGVAGVALVAAVAFVAARIVGPRLVRAATVRVEAAGTEVRGLDGDGRTTWSHRTELPIAQVDRGDVDGDGRPETIVATRRQHLERGGVEAHGEIVIVAQSGRLISRVRPDDLAEVRWPWPYEFPVALNPLFRLADLDGDGRTEVIAVCRHVTFFPTLVLVYWPRPGQWQRVLLHSGHVKEVEPVPGSSPPRLRIAGTNNRLGMLPVAGEIVVEAVGARRSPTGGVFGLESGDLSVEDAPGLTWAWYTLLEEAGGPTGLEIERDGGTSVLIQEGAIRLDPFGNPIPGPNAGRDLRSARLDFLRRLTGLNGEWSLEAGALAGRIADIETAFAPLLAERPHRAALALTASRMYAHIGAAGQAREALEAAVRVAPYEDLVFRLAHLVALDGRLAEARGLLEPKVSSPRTARASYDMAHLLLRLAIEERQEEAFAVVSERLNWTGLGSRETRFGLLATLRARAHLWWDSIEEVDCAVRSWSYAPDGEAIACLARWRLGRSAPDDPQAMERAIAGNPEAQLEGHVAMAAAQSGLGRHAEALEGLGALIPSLEAPARDDFMNRQVLDLARGVYVKALWQSGRRAEALTQARTSRPTLRDGLLPAILVDEVLAESAARQSR